MGRIAGRKTMKRYAAPGYWPIGVKNYKWTIKPDPGPHPIDRSIPLGIVLRDILGLATNMREVKYILNENEVLVDARRIREYKFPVGLMDVISIPKIGKNYRVIPSRNKVLTIKEIPESESALKICKVVNKTFLKGGRQQISLHDGRTLISDLNVKLGDSILIKLPAQEVVEHYSLSSGNKAVFIGGKNIGLLGEIIDVNDQIEVKTEIGLKRSVKTNVMVVGSTEIKVTVI